MKKIDIVNLKNLTKISDKISDTLSLLQDLDPFIQFKERHKYKQTYKYLEHLYDEIDKIIINMTDSTERDNKN